MKQEDKVFEQKFSISYDAPQGDYAEHEIDALALGNAIIGMHNLLEKAGEVVSNGSADIQVKVTDPVKSGSVVIGFIVIAKSLASAGILKTIGITAASTAIVGGSLIEVVKKIKNRKITEIVIEGDNPIATVKTASETFQVDRNVARLVGDKKVRDALTAVIRAPLEKVPDSTFNILDENDEPVVEIDTGSSESFTALPKGSLEDVTVEEYDSRVTFTQINFDSKTGWRVFFVDDAYERSVTIEDDSFLQRVSLSQHAFKKEDIYSVRVKLTSTIRPNTRSTYDYAIIKVQ